MLFTLLLASINQVFSMMDPLILGKMIDKASHFNSLDRDVFWNTIGMFLLALVGVAMVSRIAKNFKMWCMQHSKSKIVLMFKS